MNPVDKFFDDSGLYTAFILDKNQLTVGDLDYSILIDQDKGEKMFFKSILPKIGFILIYSLVIESGLEAGFPSLTEEINRSIK